MSAIALTSKFNQEHNELINLKSTLETQVIDLTSQKTNTFVNLTHELKTPLTILWNVINDLAGEKSESREIRIIKNTADEAVKKINDFLTAEKLFRGADGRNDGEINDLSAIINDKKESFEYNARLKKLAISFDIEEGVYIKADKDPIHHIVNNLIDNAVKYTDKGRIDIGLKTDGDAVIFTAADTGVGIPEELREKIFEPYYQITHEKKNIQGVGMGLSIVKGMAGLLGGSIALSSVPGKGSEFTVTLKRHRLEKGDIVASGNSRSASNIIIKGIDYKNPGDPEMDKNKPAILIVEDKPDFLYFLYRSFRERYNVFLAENGKEAVKKLGRKKFFPDVIITDLMMDGMDGNELFDTVRKSIGYEHIPFIFITAKNDDAEKMKTLQKGAQDYIYKPFLIDELISKVDNLVNNMASQREICRTDDRESALQASFREKCRKYGIASRDEAVIKLLIEGKQNKEIAGIMGISEIAIKKRISSIKNKIGKSNRTEIAILFK